MDVQRGGWTFLGLHENRKMINLSGEDDGSIRRVDAGW